jgi:hypothetical protein
VAVRRKPSKIVRWKSCSKTDVVSTGVRPTNWVLLFKMLPVPVGTGTVLCCCVAASWGYASLRTLDRSRVAFRLRRSYFDVMCYHLDSGTCLCSINYFRGFSSAVISLCFSLFRLLPVFFVHFLNRWRFTDISLDGSLKVQLTSIDWCTWLTGIV